MGECIGHDVSLRLLLQTVVADSGSRLQSGLHVAGLDRFPALIGVICPNAGKTISLQLDPHLNSICFGLVPGSALRRLRFRQNPQQVLDVMPYLVCNHVSFREFTRLAVTAAEANAHVPKERGIEVYPPVVRTIKWTHGRLRESAAALLRSGEKTQARHRIPLSIRLENFVPCVFGIAEHGGYEIAQLVFRCTCAARAWFSGLLV